MNLLYQYNLQHFLNTDIFHWLTIWQLVNIVIELIANTLYQTKRLSKEIEDLTKITAKNEQSLDRDEDSVQN